jgi:hypothetical protein
MGRIETIHAENMNLKQSTIKIMGFFCLKLNSEQLSPWQISSQVH